MQVFTSDGSKKWANRLNFLREEHRIRTEEPIDFIVPVTLLMQDLEKLSRDELKRFQIRLLKLLNFAKDQKRRINDIRKRDRIYPDRDSYSDLLATIKSIGAHLEEVKNAIGKSKALRHKRRPMDVARIFKDLCYEELPQEQFDDLHKRSVEIYKKTRDQRRYLDGM